jgi:hypothetical protein
VASGDAIGYIADITIKITGVNVGVAMDLERRQGFALWGF